MKKDPYQVLGVARGASADDIKRAFHKLAHKHHPDKGGDAEMFKEISAAYADLKDGEAAMGGNGRTYSSAFTDEASDFSWAQSYANQFNKKKFDYDYIFKEWFAKQAAAEYQRAEDERKREARREANPEYKIKRKQIDLKNAVIGVLEREIEALEEEIERM